METYGFNSCFIQCTVWHRTTIDAENKQLSLNAEQRQQVVDALGEKMLKKRLTALMAKLKPWLMEI
jgi:hypothetical protein